MKDLHFYIPMQITVLIFRCSGSEKMQFVKLHFHLVSKKINAYSTRNSDTFTHNSK